MALLARAALSNLRRQQISIHGANQQDIDPANLGMMAIGLDGSTALLQQLAADLDDDDILFIKTPTPAVQQTNQLFQDGEEFMIFIVLEKQPNSATLAFICSSEGNQVTTALQLDLGMNVTINLATHFLILSREAIDIFKPELDKHDLFVLKRNQKSQADAGLGQPAQAGGHIFQHAPTSSQQHQFAKLSEVSDLFTSQSLRKCFPGTATTDPVTASAFSMSAAVTHLKAAAHKTGLRTHDKIPDLSTLKWESFVQQNFGMDKDQFSFGNLMSKEKLLSLKSVPSEQLQHPLRLLSEIVREFCSPRWSIAVDHIAENCRILSAFNKRFTFAELEPIINRKLNYAARSFNVITLTPSCTPGMDLDLFLLQTLKDSLTISRSDEDMQFILFSSADGSGDSSVDSSVGAKRPRQPPSVRPGSDDDSSETETSDSHRDWLSHNPIPHSSICWDWALQESACGNTTTCHRPRPQPHCFPKGTKKSTQQDYYAWLKLKPT